MRKRNGRNGRNGRRSGRRSGRELRRLRRSREIVRPGSFGPFASKLRAVLDGESVHEEGCVEVLLGEGLVAGEAVGVGCQVLLGHGGEGRSKLGGREET